MNTQEDTPRLAWQNMQCLDMDIPSDEVSAGIHVRMVMSYRLQYDFLNRCFPRFVAAEQQNKVCLFSGGEVIPAGSPQFCLQVGSMVRHRGLMANLSIRENLLLPFACVDCDGVLEDAHARVDEVAAFLGLEEQLDKQAGERSVYTHALVSLGCCMLKRVSVIVAQEVHVGMPPARLQLFRERFWQVVDSLDAGVLYLTSAADDAFAMNFVRTHEVVDAEGMDVSGLW